MEMEQAMSRAETLDGDPILSGMVDTVKSLAVQLYHLLVALCNKGRPVPVGES